MMLRDLFVELELLQYSCNFFFNRFIFIELLNSVFEKIFNKFTYFFPPSGLGKPFSKPLGKFSKA